LFWIDLDDLLSGDALIKFDKYAYYLDTSLKTLMKELDGHVEL